MEVPLREWVEEAVLAAALNQQLAPRDVTGVALAAGDALEFALRGCPTHVPQGHQVP